MSNNKRSFDLFLPRMSRSNSSEDARNPRKTLKSRSASSSNLSKASSIFRSTTKLFSKRLTFRRTDSGVSSDSGDQVGSVTSGVSTMEEDEVVQEATYETCNNNIIDDDDDDGDHSDCRLLTSFDSNSSPLVDCELEMQYEKRLVEVRHELELTTQRFYLLEEHLCDMRQENEHLRKQLAAQEALYKKKIQLRQDEIESFKQTIIQQEEMIRHCRTREAEWNQHVARHADEVKLLQQQISAQELCVLQCEDEQCRLAEVQSNLDRVQKSLDEERVERQVQVCHFERINREQSVQLEELAKRCQRLCEELDILRLEKADLLANHQQLQLRQHIQSQHYKHSSRHHSSEPPSASVSPTPPINVPKASLMTYRQLQNQMEMEPGSTTTMPSSQRYPYPLVSITRPPMERIISCDTDDEPEECSSNEMSFDGGTTNSLLNDLMDSNNNVVDEHEREKHNCSQQGEQEHQSTIQGITTIGAANGLTPEYFPSLPDAMLRKLCLLQESCCSLESLTAPEVDIRFKTLSVAFKTDKCTLEQRLNLYRHQREMAEKDAKAEVNHLLEYIHELNRLLFGRESRIFDRTSNVTQLRDLKDMLTRLEMQAQVIHRSSMKISAKAELYGSVRQEQRLSGAFDLIMMHTENLRRSKEKHAKQLKVYKKIVEEKGLRPPEAEDELFASLAGRRTSVRSMSNPKLNLVRVRRASVAAITITEPSQSPKELNVRRIVNGGSCSGTSGSFTTSIDGSSGGGPSATYLRTRRLSVPASTIRNRPKLLQMLSEQSRLSVSSGIEEEEVSRPCTPPAILQPSLSVDSSEADVDTPASSGVSSVDGAAATVAASHAAQALTEEDGASSGMSLLEVHHDARKVKKLSITPVDEACCAKSGDCSLDSEDSDTECVECRAANKRLDRNRFYHELMQKLEPLEERTVWDRVSHRAKLWSTVIFNIFLLLIEMLSSRNTLRTCRYVVSGTLALISLIIFIWSILLPIAYPDWQL